VGRSSLVLACLLLVSCATTSTDGAGTSPSESASVAPTGPAPSASEAQVVVSPPPFGLSVVPEGRAAALAALEAIPKDVRGPVRWISSLERFAPVDFTLPDGSQASMIVMPWGEVRAYPGKPGSIAFMRMFMEQTPTFKASSKSLDPSKPLAGLRNGSNDRPAGGVRVRRPRLRVGVLDQRRGPGGHAAGR
jgi:hypothetical protein